MGIGDDSQGIIIHPAELARLQEAEAENKRLREALERIDGWPVLTRAEVAQIAHDALNPKVDDDAAH